MILNASKVPPRIIFIILGAFLFVFGLWQFRAKSSTEALINRADENLVPAEGRPFQDPHLGAISAAKSEQARPPSEPKTETKDSTVAWTPVESKKWDQILDVLKSKNDNDPRLDQELKNLNMALRERVYSYYSSLPQEQRNERGTLAFLISRDIKSNQDVHFLESIFAEKPCYSLGHCTEVIGSDPHLSSVDQVSLNYPQLAVLYQIQQFMDSHPRDDWPLDKFQKILLSAATFPVPVVYQKAQELLKRI
jgi:hypothetical protein